MPAAFSAPASGATQLAYSKISPPQPHTMASALNLPPVHTYTICVPHPPPGHDTLHCGMQRT